MFYLFSPKPAAFFQNSNNAYAPPHHQYGNSTHYYRLRAACSHLNTWRAGNSVMSATHAIVPAYQSGKPAGISSSIARRSASAESNSVPLALHSRKVKSNIIEAASRSDVIAGISGKPATSNIKAESTASLYFVTNTQQLYTILVK